MRSPFAFGVLLFFLAFSASGSAHLSGGSSSGAFPGRNGEIVFLSQGSPKGDSNLYVMRPDGTKQRRITSAPGVEMFPRWSPDGKWVAFARGPQQLCPQIYLVSAVGTGLRRVTHDRGCYNDLTWSPDGKRLAFLRQTGAAGKPPTFTIATININGTGLRTLTDGQSLDFDPAWSPDGTTIAFERVSSMPRGIWLMDADGTNQRQLTTPPTPNSAPDGEDREPAWSPNGQWIAFSRDHDPHDSSTGMTTYRSDIYVIRPDGTDLRQLTRLDGVNRSPTWSPDGKRIAFTSDRGHPDLTDIYVMNADGTRQTRIKTASGDSPDWQPRP